MGLRQTYLACAASARSKAAKALRYQIHNHSIDFSDGNAVYAEKNPAKGLFFKTNNIFGADFKRFRRSDGVSACEGRAFGSTLVRMVLSRFSLAAGIRTVGYDFTSNPAFVPRFGGQFAVTSAVA